jgi:hypothetical protein
MLCMGHERADPKLTLSERVRITGAFFTAWDIILGSPFDSNEEKMARLSPKDVLYVRELALFMYNNLDDAQHREVAGLMGYDEDGDVQERWLELITATGGYYEDVGITGFWQPDYAPLGLGLLIDDYQKDYVEDQADRYYQALRWQKIEEETRR